ncbi:hypothetical protein AMECASPLE_007117 [Ameca splendens]|uniref:Uncharacterized protein n=1 Tax=Ameca splendens TaxID=208324 RepID=A0ABV0YM13_9TELE
MPPLYLQVNLVFSGLETSPFSSKCKKGPYGQTLHFYVSFDDKIFLHKARFVLFGNCNLAYYDAIGVTASSSLIGLDNEMLTNFTSSQQAFTFVVGLIFTFCTHTCSSLGHRTCLLSEQYDLQTFAWCLYLNVSPSGSGNCTQRLSRLVNVHNPLPDILADFFRFFFHDVTQGSNVLPENTTTGVTSSSELSKIA